jgi:hypothetical protein
MTSRSLRASRPLVTVERVLAGLVIVLVAFGLLMSLVTFDTVFFYVLFILATVFMVRSATVEPGAWLGRRAVRRGLVVVIAIITLDFLSIGTGDNAAVGFGLFVLLALCDLALGRATRRIATAEPGQLDERQEQLRNRAHREAYAILAVTIGAIVLIAEFATPTSRLWLSGAVSGTPIIGFLEMVFFLPAIVIAWREPDRITGADALPIAGALRRRIAYGMVALAFVLPFLLSATLAGAPLRTSAFTRMEPVVSGPGTVPNLQCRYFQARTTAGVGFGATIPISAAACWNGTRAEEDWGLNASDCHPLMTEFVTDTTLECRRTTAPDGTLAFTYRTRLQSPLIPFMSREVVMSLKLGKDGKVLQFP